MLADAEQHRWSFPLVSVVIPSHERTQELVEAIESVLRQDYPCIEVFVVYTPRRSIIPIGERYQDRVVFVPSNSVGQMVNPIASKRNQGVSLCRGTFIAFSDDDDIWHPKKMSLQIQAFKELPGIVACCTGVGLFVHGPPAFPMGGKGSTTVRCRQLSVEEVGCSEEIATSSMMVRREALENSMFSLDMNTTGVEDYKLWLELLGSGRIAKIEETLCYLRVTKQGYSGQIAAVQHARCLLVLAAWPGVGQLRTMTLFRIFLTRCLAITRHPYDPYVDDLMKRVVTSRVGGRISTILWLVLRWLWCVPPVQMTLARAYALFRKRFPLVREP